MKVIQSRDENDPNWVDGVVCLRDDIVDSSVSNFKRLLDRKGVVRQIRVVERCDVCGKEITEENRGQTTTEGVICKDCLEKNR